MNLYSDTICQLDSELLKAGEIIKYLNMELENYKNTYDIFKPGK